MSNINQVTAFTKKQFHDAVLREFKPVGCGHIATAQVVEVHHGTVLVIDDIAANRAIFESSRASGSL
jgi:hypothetical protein